MCVEMIIFWVPDNFHNSRHRGKLLAKKFCRHDSTNRPHSVYRAGYELERNVQHKFRNLNQPLHPRSSKLRLYLPQRDLDLKGGALGVRAFDANCSFVRVDDAFDQS